MAIDYFNRDVKYASKLWIHLMAAHIKKVAKAYQEQDFFKNVITSITKNYTLRFSSIEHLKEIQKIFPGENKVIENTQDRYLEISNLMLRLLKKSESENLKEQLINGPYPQDEIQSQLELDYLGEYIDLAEMDYIIELGAGYGRIPSLLIKKQALKKYIIVDIPPALWISKTYLKENFPDIKVAPYTSDLNSDKLNKLLNEYQVISLSPSQMQYLPKNLKAAVIAINCLQEMPPQTIEDYFSTLSKVAQYFYLKAMKKPHDPWSDAFLHFEQYLENNFWTILHQRATPFPTNYAEVILKKA